MDQKQLAKAVENTRKAMFKAAKEMDFLEAARLRDELFELEKLQTEKYG
jgi:excinuclease ABC subunit B